MTLPLYCELNFVYFVVDEKFYLTTKSTKDNTKDTKEDTENYFLIGLR